MKSLWGVDFEIPEKKIDDKKILKRVTEKKETSKDTTTVVKKLKSKSVKITLDERLNLIRDEVYRILGVYKEDTICIRDVETLHNYIDCAIKNGIIAVDTETNNSLDPITCKIMGGCIYTPGQKNAYIPVNHVNSEGGLLERQVTEKDLQRELSRLCNTKIIMHNGKFDYSVIKCTCNVELSIYWDTLIGAKLLDENELSAGLKQQYISKIDPSIEKYSIEHLFKDVEYAVVDPELFALYAATDAFMTYKLYLWQVEQFNKAENKRIKKLFFDIEMPLVVVLAEMEMAGMEVDQEYGADLSVVYHSYLDEVDKQLNTELEKIRPTIDKWRLTPEANYKPPKKTGDGEGKSKSEQLTDPINMGSPTQLAIVLYDVLKAPVVNKKSPRGTGEAEILAIKEKLKLPICDLLMKKRELTKLISTYIDSIPELASKWPDGRIRTHFNQYGAATGRLSCGGEIAFGVGDKVSGINF